jgi:hypothetical protein
MRAILHCLLFCFAALFALAGIVTLWGYRSGGHPVEILTVLAIVRALPLLVASKQYIHWPADKTGNRMIEQLNNYRVNAAFEEWDGDSEGESMHVITLE